MNAMKQNRRKFFTQALAFGSAMGFATASGFARPFAGVWATGPIDPVVVKEFVGVAHSNFDCTKEILEAHPLILHAAWDWGDGDFETAIGAAGHVGNRQIAEYLLEKGARADIFVLTMLGETALVKSLLDRFPKLLHSLGPHGYTLLHHAKKGGEPAAELAGYLGDLGLTETFVNIYNKKK